MKKAPEVRCAYDEMVALADLKENPRNPNRHPEGQIALLARLIEHHGWRAPVTVSKRSGLVVRGHGRLAAARLLGLAEVPVDYQEYGSDEDELADLVADNRIAELAETDYSTLRELLEAVDTGALDLELTGYTEDEIAVLMTSVGWGHLGGIEPEGVWVVADLQGVVPVTGDYAVLHFRDDAESYAAFVEWAGGEPGTRSFEGPDIVTRLRGAGLV